MASLIFFLQFDRCSTNPTMSIDAANKSLNQNDNEWLPEYLALGPAT